MLTLSALKKTRISHGLGRPQLADLTGIAAERLKAIELREAEPWYDEAMVLHRVLNTHGILDLILSGDLTTLPGLAGLPLPNDLAIWQAGGRVPLSLALRVSLKLGLDDPCLLSVGAILRQLWDVLQATERHPEAPGWCAWCAADIFAGEDHLPTCLPHALLSRLPDDPGMVRMPVLRPAVRGQAQAGLPAYGLKALRLERELLQRDVAAFLEVSPNHYARLERAETPLTQAHAVRLAAAWGVEVVTVYAPPPDEPAPVAGAGQ